MKKFAKLAFALTFGISVASYGADWASIYHSLIAFDERPEVVDGNRPGYVKPLATNIGAVLNSNWAVSAGVPESFAFEIGLPIALFPITNSDRKYAGDAPTIFGGKDYEWGTVSTMIGSDMSCTSPAGLGCHVVNGNENLNALPLFTLPYLQAAASFYHARAAFRFMMLPAVSELRSFSLFGFGLQYSFGHFFQYRLPSMLQGLDVSLLFGYNTSSIGYQPDDYRGELDLDITATTVDMVVGYKPFNLLEVMVTMGYQYANMESSGSLLNKKDGATIKPSLGVKGNNGFRFGLEIALNLGASYHPVVGYNYVGKSGFTTNILYFKQQFGKDATPDEIAKKKEHNRTEQEPEESSDDITVTNEEAAPVDENANPADAEATPSESPMSENTDAVEENAPAAENTAAPESDAVPADAAASDDASTEADF